MCLIPSPKCEVAGWSGVSSASCRHSARRGALTVMAACAVASGLSADAHADVDPGQSAAPAVSATTAAPPTVDPEAVRLYDEGLRYFSIGEYDQAIDRLKASYLKAPLPALLYDLGQAFRLKGDCAEALSFYRRFLKTEPTGQRHERTSARIADMERCVATATAQAQPVDTNLKPPIPDDPSLLIGSGAPRDPAGPAPDPRQRHRRRWGIGAGAAAAVLASASGYFAWRAANAGDDVSGAFVPGGSWNSTAQDAERTGILSDRLAVATGAGALLVAGVATWLLWR